MRFEPGSSYTAVKHATNGLDHYDLHCCVSVETVSFVHAAALGTVEGIAD